MTIIHRQAPTGKSSFIFLHSVKSAFFLNILKRTAYVQVPNTIHIVHFVSISVCYIVQCVLCIYSVYCSVCIANCTACKLHYLCTIVSYIVFFTMYLNMCAVQCILCIAQCMLYKSGLYKCVLCNSLLYSVHCVLLYSVYLRIEYNVECVLYSVLCTAVLNDLH